MKLQQLLGANIRIHRKANGLSQTELAAKIGINRSTVGLIERGQISPSLKRTVIIAEALNIDPVILFGVDTMPSGDRGALMTDIHTILSGMTTKQLVTVKRTLHALKGS